MNNFIVTRDKVTTISRDISSPSHYVKNSDLEILMRDRDARIKILEELKVNEVIITLLGDKCDNDSTYEKKDSSLIKVGELKWL